MATSVRPRIGMLWGDFSGASAPAKFDQLWSMGRVARDVTRALSMFGEVVPFCPPPGEDTSSTTYRSALSSFLRNIDVLWADVYPMSGPALMLRDELELSCPAILFVGGAAAKGVEALLFPWQHLLRSSDGLLFSCHADQEIWQRLVEYSELHEWVVPLCADETVFHPCSVDECSAIKQQYHLPLNAPLLLYVGRMNFQKNLHSLLYLLQAVRQQVPDAYLCFVGEEDTIVQGEFQVRNTGYVAWLQALAIDLGLTEHVHFPGPLFGKQLACIYTAADVVVNLSFNHRENFGLSLAEAAACGTPAICTRWGGFKDVVLEEESGYFVDAVLTKHGIRVNWRQGADAVVKLLQQPLLRKKMGERALSLAHERFSTVALSQRLARAVVDVLSTCENSCQPAYIPGQFARRLEEHKRACGWYETAPVVVLKLEEQNTIGEVELHWRPPVFQGRDYELYETLMQPYATRLAFEDQLPANWLTNVPYFPSQTRLNSIRLLIECDDPIWSHRLFLPIDKWEVVKSIDGYRTVEEIAALSGYSLEICMAILWAMYIEGFVLFIR
jgi:glycosyltransferase involved in cell wall biosynthesis